MYANCDLESVKSMPLLTKARASNANSYSRSRISLNTPQQPEEKGANIRRSMMKLHWKQKLLPQVLQKYDQIVSQGFEWNKDEKRGQQILNAEDSPIKKYEFEKNSNWMSRQQLQERVKSLQQQNSNLREQLYYLREAILLNFRSQEKQ